MSLQGLNSEDWVVVQRHAQDTHRTANILAPSVWSGFRAKTEKYRARRWVYMPPLDRLPYLIEAARRIALYKSASSQNWMNGEETLVSVISARIFCEEMVMKVSKSKDAQMLKKYVEKGLESVGVQMWLEKYMKRYNRERNKYQLKAKDWLNGLRKIKVIQQTNPFTSRQLRYEDGPSSSQHFAEMNTCTSDAVPNQYTTGSHISTLVSVSPSPAVLQRPPSYDTFYHEHSSLSTDELNLPITKGPNGMLNLKPPKGPRATLEAQSAGRAWFNMV